MSFHGGNEEERQRIERGTPTHPAVAAAQVLGMVVVLVVVCLLVVVPLRASLGLPYFPWQEDRGPKQVQGPLPKPAKQGQGPVTRLHQFYGPLSPEEGDPGWNCLTQGGKSC